MAHVEREWIAAHLLTVLGQVPTSTLEHWDEAEYYQDNGRYCQGEWDTDGWATNLVDHFSLWVEGRFANLPDCYSQLKNLVRQSVRFTLDTGGYWPELRAAVAALPELIPCEGED